MLRFSLIVGQILSTAALVLTAGSLQAIASTAYVSVCCNAPSTAGVFNPSTLKQTGNIVTGSGGDGIALSPDGTKMYVTVDYKRELQVIATNGGAVLATVPVPISVSGEPPIELAISPDGSHVYLFAPQAGFSSSVLMAVDTTTYSITASTTGSYGASQGPFLISPDGTQLYFEQGYANEYIQVLDAATLAPVKQIPVNEDPSDLAVTPSGMILMTDSSQQLLVIDPQTSAVTALPLPSNNGTPANVISSPDSTTAYISFAVPPSILALNIATGVTLFQAPVSSTPTHFAISPDGSTLYSTNLFNGEAWSLSEFSIPEQRQTAAVRQLGPITGMALTVTGQALYVLNANDSAVAAVDVATKTVTHARLAGAEIGPLAIPPGGNTVWASQYSFGAGGDLLFVNPVTWQIKYLANISGAIAFSPEGTFVYIYNPGGVTAYDVASLTPKGAASVGQLTNLDQVIPSPDGTRLYMSVSYVSGTGNHPGPTGFAPGAIFVLDTYTFKYIASIDAPDGMGALALTPDGTTLVYTASFGRVHLASTATYKVTATLHLTPATGYFPGLALSPDGATAYVADAQNNLLLTANLQTQEQGPSFAVGASPSPVVISPDGSEAWVATLTDLDVVNLATAEVSAVALPGEPEDIVFAP